MWSIVIAGLLLGLVSSLHCIGMCGPLMMALPVSHMTKRKQVLAIFLYNTGRIVTYSLIGVLLGLAGRRIYLAGFQRWFSITLGVIILLAVIHFYFKHTAIQPQWLQWVYAQVRQLMFRFLQSKRMSGYLFLGIANGLLPCGMVYLAVAGALTATSVGGSVLFMFVFGAGTLPAMLLLGVFGMRITLPVRQQLKTAIPFMMAAMAIILILRGLNLGIPFISPVIADVPGNVISCH
ncbi:MULTISPECIES: sulfite exporter TauE/SafE family protein [Niastella]|uniref:Sulfite exporter TauE/SafE family protein n=1 Tax=Niastella soli TaxID=2821487 RepID=A0ABS3YVX6_9BACT|nr:sulfite exporter TauE/SafE family protein [Niastella soli]MBO9201898.1 sulfite exporter TauE/SafE family protein [Niastella soli]